MKVTYISTLKHGYPTIKPVRFQQYLNLIKDSNYKNQIEHLRTLEYASQEYKAFKKNNLPAFKIHGEFSGLNNADLMDLNGYLYFDIDNFSDVPPTKTECPFYKQMSLPQRLNVTKQALIDTGYVSHVYKSCGGRGLSFLVYVPSIKSQIKNDYLNVWQFIKETYFGGFTVDNQAKSLNRNIFLSYDPDIYSKEVELNVDLSKLNSILKGSTGTSGVLSKSGTLRKKGKVQFGLNVPLIEYKDIVKQIVTKSVYEKEIDGDYVYDPIDYYEIYVPQNIYDGSKHRVYSSIINKLIYLNPTITLLQTLSYIVNVNSHAKPPMAKDKLYSYVEFLYDTIVNKLISSGGETTIKCNRVKKIHFNKSKNLTMKEKQSIAAKEIGRRRTNNTIDRIDNARKQLVVLGRPVTQKNVELYIAENEEKPICLKTIKRNWNKEKADLSSTITLKTEKEAKQPIQNASECDIEINYTDTDVSIEDFFGPDKKEEEFEIKYYDITNDPRFDF